MHEASTTFYETWSHLLFAQRRQHTKKSFSRKAFSFCIKIFKTSSIIMAENGQDVKPSSTFHPSPVKEEHSSDRFLIQNHPVSVTQQTRQEDAIVRYLQQDTTEIYNPLVMNIFDIGEADSHDLLNQHVYLKRRGEISEQSNAAHLFETDPWTTPRSFSKANEWTFWQNVKSKAHKQIGDTYYQFEVESDMSTFLKSHLVSMDVFPNVVNDPKHDYPLFMEIIRFAGLDYAQKESITIVKVADPSDAFANAFHDVAKGKNILVKSFPARNIGMKTKEGLDPSNLYMLTNHDIYSFHDSLATAQCEHFGSSANGGATIVYAKIQEGADLATDKFYNFHRIMYSYVCLAAKTLAEGGSLIINTSDLGMDGFCISNMYFLYQLFSELVWKKPAAALSTSTEIIIIAKGFLKHRNAELISQLLQGNVYNTSMSMNKYPLPRKAIPNNFLERAVEAGVVRLDWILKHNKRNFAGFAARHNSTMINMRNRYVRRTANMWQGIVRMEDYVYGPGAPKKQDAEED